MRIPIWARAVGFLLLSLSGLSLAQAQDSTPAATTAANVKWTFQAQAGLVSSPVIVDDTVYVGSDDHHLYALDRTTGKQRWAFEAGDMILGTPVVDGGRVYIGSDDRHLYALNASDGSVIWSFDAGGWVNSPLLVDGTLYIGIDCTADDCADYKDIAFGLYAVDAQTGTEKWKFNTSASVTSQAAYADGVVYLGDLNGTVYALDAASGSSKWKFMATGGSIASTLTTLLLDGQTLYVGSQGGRFYALDTATGKPNWHFDTAGWVYSPPAIDGDTLYLGSADHKLYALDRASGKELWNTTFDAEVGNPVLRDGLLYLVSFDNSVYVFDPSSRKIAWSFPTESYVLGRPAFDGDTILFPARTATSTPSRFPSKPRASAARSHWQAQPPPGRGLA